MKTMAKKETRKTLTPYEMTAFSAGYLPGAIRSIGCRAAKEEGADGDVNIHEFNICCRLLRADIENMDHAPADDFLRGLAHRYTEPFGLETIEMLEDSVNFFSRCMNFIEKKLVADSDISVQVEDDEDPEEKEETDRFKRVSFSETRENPGVFWEKQDDGFGILVRRNEEILQQVSEDSHSVFFLFGHTLGEMEHLDLVRRIENKKGRKPRRDFPSPVRKLFAERPMLKTWLAKTSKTRLTFPSAYYWILAIEAGRQTTFLPPVATLEMIFDCLWNRAMSETIDFRYYGRNQSRDQYFKDFQKNAPREGRLIESYRNHPSVWDTNSFLTNLQNSGIITEK